MKRLVQCDDPKCAEQGGGVSYYVRLEDALQVLQTAKGLRLGFLVIVPPAVEQLENDRTDARLSFHVLAAVYGDKCLVCETTDQLLVDHIIPLSRGGNSGIENLQILCRTCNFRKGIRIIDYRPFPFEREIQYCRACQKMQLKPFTLIYWMGEHCEVCAECLPEYRSSAAVIDPQLDSEYPWLGCVS